MEWLADFGVESPDIAILDRPLETIVSVGGAILFARVGAEVVGTCALLPTSTRGHFELIKMAVTREYQGRGIGRQLLIAAIRRFESSGGTELHLETSSRLKTAIRLYESLGFHVAQRPGTASLFARADVYMVYGGATESGKSASC